MHVRFPTSQSDGQLSPPARSSLRRRPARSRRACAFTLVELLVVMGLIAVLMAILFPVIHTVRDSANTDLCASHLKDIGTAMQAYAMNNDGCLFPMRDYAKWTDPTNPTGYWSPYKVTGSTAYAYWGVAYVLYAGAKKEWFNCPSARGTAGSATNADGSFDSGAIYTCYGENGYGGWWSGWSNSKRQSVFGNGEYCALFRKGPSSGINQWVGRSMLNIKNSNMLVVVQDAYEQVLDGNGDTFDDWYQWTPPQHTPDESFEWLRHNNQGNCLFADWHVGQLDRTAQTDVRYYSGMW